MLLIVLNKFNDMFFYIYFLICLSFLMEYMIIYKNDIIRLLFLCLYFNKCLDWVFFIYNIFEYILMCLMIFLLCLMCLI